MERDAIYLDSNVVIDVSEGRDDELLGLLFRSIYMGPYCYPFSAELIGEITNIDVEYKKRNEHRMLLVEGLSRKIYFANTLFDIGYRKEKPLDVFNTINEVGSELNFNAIFANIIPFDQILGVREAFSLDSVTLNMMGPLEAINYIDNALSNYEYDESNNYQKPPRSMKEIIEILSKINNENNSNVGIGAGEKAEHDGKRAGLVMFFSLLDTFGYWGDPRKKYKRGSRMSDAIHALVGSYFKAVVSRDLHFLHKSKAAYEYIGIQTLTYSTNEFKLHLKEVIPNNS